MRSIAAFEAALELAKLGGENCLDVSITFELLGRTNIQFELLDESVDCYHNAYKIRAKNDEVKVDDRLNLIRDMVDRYKNKQKYEKALIACSIILSTQQDMKLSDVEIVSTEEIMGDLHCMVGDRIGVCNGLICYREISENIIRQNNSSHESLIPIYLKMAKILGSMSTKNPSSVFNESLKSDSNLSMR